jgi:hypothetical protein
MAVATRTTTPVTGTTTTAPTRTTRAGATAGAEVRTTVVPVEVNRGWTGTDRGPNAR